MGVHCWVDDLFHFQRLEIRQKIPDVVRVVMTKHGAFRKFEDSVGAIDFFPRAVTLPVAGIAVQKEVVHIQQSARTEHPPDLPDERLLRLTGDNAG